VRIAARRRFTDASNQKLPIIPAKTDDTTLVKLEIAMTTSSVL
jgi:hypothetical protein